MVQSFRLVPMMAAMVLSNMSLNAVEEERGEERKMLLTQSAMVLSNMSLNAVEEERGEERKMLLTQSTNTDLLPC